MTLHDYKLFCPNYQFFSNGEICFDCLKNKNYRSCLSKKCIKNSLIKSLISYLEAKWQKDFLKTAKKINVFLAPSLFMKRQALKWGMPIKKVIHLPYAISVDKSQELMQSKNYSQKKNPYLLYFGRLSQEKGIDLLIKVFLKDLGKLKNYHLKIVGQGPEREKLENLAKGEKQIEFLGQKSKRQLKEIIDKAYLIIVPSIWPENLPFSVLESFASGKAVLAAKIGGQSELVKDNKTGLSFKLNDESDLREKIIWAIGHSKKIKQIGQAAQKEVLAKCNPENHYQRLIRIYERLV